MSAAEALSDRIFPKDYFGERPLRGCRGRKRDNVVVIEVDTDEYGELIILDVPDSFREKFRKRPKHVISIDDDDGGEGGEGREGSSSDATSSDRCSPRTPTQAARASTSAFVDENVDESNTPVKLSKSKRTYSGKSIPRNRYGPSPDSEGGLSESDCSDCELVEGSGKLREQWEKASSRRRHDARFVPPDFGSKAGSSVPSNNVHDGPEESTPEDVESLGQQSSVKECSLHNDADNAVSGSSHTSSEESSEQDYDPMDVDEDEQVPRTCDEISSGLDDKEKDRNSEPMGDVKFTNEVFSRDYSAAVAKEPPQEEEFDNAALLNRQQDAEVQPMQSDVTHGCGHANGVVLSSEQNNVITDRQKMKETEEYKLAMEEELAARQQQLLLQAEEARKLKMRKKAEKMRLMMNERRQKDRLEEIRQTRRKDEENLNLKEKHRVEVKKELKIIEAMCGDMGSLLRYLGIHVGGGPFPSPNEVQAAYKRACLKFHPDRISTTDLRQQVEAEEKFKLISNMKDKFMLR